MTRETRQEEIRKVQKDYKLFYVLILGVIVLGIGVWIGASMFKEDSGYGVNLFTELLGIGVTVFIIDQLRAYRDKGSLKRRLVREAGSRSNDIAISAVSWLRAEGWLTGDDGLLQDKDLSGANLQNADLKGANLQNTTLYETQLQNAKLQGAEMQNAKLISADLCGAGLDKDSNLTDAILINANLREARLVGANLTDAKLLKAKLRGAHLWETILKGADLRSSEELKEARWLNTANLEDAIMHFIDLQDTDLSECRMKGASLCRAELQDANLRGANLEGASLHMAELQDADLRGTNLEGAILLGAYLEGAHFQLRETRAWSGWEGKLEHEHVQPATVLTGATLPDGSKFPNSPAFEEMDRFTIPDHRDFPKTLQKINEIRRAMELHPIQS